jgi:hypothetical protein
MDSAVYNSVWVVDSIRKIHRPTKKIGKAYGIMQFQKKAYSILYDYVKDSIAYNTETIDSTKFVNTEYKIRPFIYYLQFDNKYLYCLFPERNEYFKSKYIKKRNAFYCRMWQREKDIAFYLKLYYNQLIINYSENNYFWTDSVTIYLKPSKINFIKDSSTKEIRPITFLPLLIIRN